MQRTRAWRRGHARKDACKNARKKAACPARSKPEKNWKLLYRRADKLLRARQLGLSYPIVTTRQLLDNT